MLEGTVVMARLLLLGQIRNPQQRGFAPGRSGKITNCLEKHSLNTCTAVSADSQSHPLARPACSLFELLSGPENACKYWRPALKRNNGQTPQVA